MQDLGDIEVRGTGTLQIDGNDIKPANLLPSTLSNLMSGDQNITGMFASAVEDRAHDGRDMFSKGFEGYGPYRRVDAEKFFETGGSGASMRRAKVFGAAKKTGPRKSKQNEKVKPIDNPFVIVLGTKPLVK